MNEDEIQKMARELFVSTSWDVAECFRSAETFAAECERRRPVKEEPQVTERKANQ